MTSRINYSVSLQASLAIAGQGLTAGQLVITNGSAWLLATTANLAANPGNQLCVALDTSPAGGPFRALWIGAVPDDVARLGAAAESFVGNDGSGNMQRQGSASGAVGYCDASGLITFLGAFLASQIGSTGITSLTGPVTANGPGAAATSVSVNASAALTGTLAVANGGTGLATPGSSGDYLTSTGGAWASTPFGPSSLPTITITGAVAGAASGGTIATTYSGALPQSLGGTGQALASSIPVAGDVIGTAGANTVVAITGSGSVVPVAAQTILWPATAAFPTLTQDTRASDTACSDIVIAPQPGFASATGTHKTGGNFVVSLAAPSNSGTGSPLFIVKQHNTAYLGVGPGGAGDGSAYTSLFFGAAAIAAPTTSNHSFLGNGTDCYFNAPIGSIYLTIGNSTHAIQIDGNSIQLTPAGGSQAGFGGGAGVVTLANAGTAPTSNPSGGIIAYGAAGALTVRGSGGAITTASATGQGTVGTQTNQAGSIARGVVSTPGGSVAAATIAAIALATHHSAQLTVSITGRCTANAGTPGMSKDDTFAVVGMFAVHNASGTPAATTGAGAFPLPIAAGSDASMGYSQVNFVYSANTITIQVQPGFNSTSGGILANVGPIDWQCDVYGNVN